jgi:hypothetical protein
MTHEILCHFAMAASLTENIFCPIITPLFPQVMIYELADHVQGFLSEHNKPPSSSFHEEMMKDQRLQQERLALEEQEKLDQRRSKEEQMVRLWLKSKGEERRKGKKTLPNRCLHNLQMCTFCKLVLF